MRTFILVLILVISSTAYGETVTITASQDNTIYTEGGQNSNGAGTNIFTGRNQGEESRRALVAFKDLSAIPSDATIESVKLHLRLNKKSAGSVASSMALHRLTSDWGEGTSNAPGQEGSGTIASEGDATWTFSFYSDTNWNTPGGDFASSASGQTNIDEPGEYTVGSTASMVSEVLGWLDNPNSNFGWIIIGDENNWTARRFFSRESSLDTNRPRLEIEFSGGTTGGGFSLDPGHNGNWWAGASRNGEGVQIEVSNNGSGGLVLVATMYSYNPDGQPIFLLAVGQIVDGEAVVDVYIYEGPMWGPGYDPADWVETQWGTGLFTASSCDAISMVLTPNPTFVSEGYSALSSELVRLTDSAIPCPLN